MAENAFEIPRTLRDLSEQNLKQAHAAYEQLTDFVTKSMGAWSGVPLSNGLAAGFKDLQDRALEIAMENAQSTFTFASKITNAHTPQEVFALQTQFVQERMQALVTQTQQLYSVIGEALQTAQRG